MIRVGRIAGSVMNRNDSQDVAPSIFAARYKVPGMVFSAASSSTARSGTPRHA